jgi:predicted nucleotidyltransferase
MENINEKINVVKEAILKNVQAKYVYLFGSYAYGEPQENSDIDILAVVPDHVKNHLFLYGDIMYDIDSRGEFVIDLQIVRESVFNKRKNDSLFVGTIVQKGKLLYES